MKARLHARLTTEKHNSFNSSVREKKILLQQCRNRKEVEDIFKEVKNGSPKCQLNGEVPALPASGEPEDLLM